MCKAGVNPDLFSWNFLLKTYKNPVHVRAVIAEMQEAGANPYATTWNTLLRLYRKQSDLRAVMQEMQEAGITPDVYTWSTLIKSCSHSTHIRDVMEEMREAKVEPNVATWTLLLRSYKRPEEMMEVLDEMLVAGVSPDSLSYLTLFECYMRNDGAHDVLDIYKNRLLRKEHRGIINHLVATIIIQALAVCGSEIDIKTFFVSSSNVLRRSDINYLMTLSENSSRADWRWGMLRHLLSDMRRSSLESHGVVADTVIHIAA